MLDKTMKPFWLYYGGKWRLTPKYSAPTFDTIVEPFAGAAGYSTRYPDRRVVLYDLDPKVVGTWDYIIRTPSAEILGLPDIEPGQTVDDLAVCQEARWLIGWWLNQGSAQPKKSPSKWMADKPGSHWGLKIRSRIALQADRIRHWTVRLGSWDSIRVDHQATWFVDPPYQVAGTYYTKSSKAIDFAALGNWCRTRSGQVIVCENAGADWLDFKDLAEIQGTTKRSKEVVWEAQNA